MTSLHASPLTMHTAFRPVLLTTLLLGICWSGSRAQNPVEAVTETVAVPTPAYDRYLKARTEADRLLSQRDRDGLEALAAKLRASREILDDSTSLLSGFYREVDQIAEEEPGQAEAMAFFEKWATERPDSITAQVCFANALTSYAWNACGTGWGNSVSDEGRKLFRARLNQAWEVLERAWKLPAKCPGWYSAAQTVALGQGWDRTDYLNMATEAISAEPTFGEYYTDAFYWLLPRWHGEEGDFERWLAERADTFPEAQRDRQYARMVWLADSMPVDGEIVFGPGHLDWERVKRGFDDWLRETPDNLMVRSEYIRLALLADDRATVRAQFETMGRKEIPSMWYEDDFEGAWRYAFAAGPNPLLTEDEPEAPSLRKLSPESLEKARLIIKLVINLGGGAIAGILLLILALQRRQVWPGIIALAASVILAGILGTALTVVPAAGLWLYLRRHPMSDLGIVRSRSGWLTLLGVFSVDLLNFAVQIGATILIAVVLVLEDPSLARNSEKLLSVLMGDSELLMAMTISAWLAFLLLIAICRPQSAESWRDRLGLHFPAWNPALLWTGAAAIAMLGVNFLIGLVQDERTIEAMAAIKSGWESPFVFLLAIVLVIPVFEELLFRGYAFSGWIDKLGVAGTILVSSILFAVTHIQYGWTGLVYVFCLGLILSVLRWRTGSVYPGIVLHCCSNLGSCLLLLNEAPQ